jgi:hypothetical protein
MGELPHNAGALGPRQNTTEGRILPQGGALFGLGEEFGAKRRPRLAQTPLPLGLQPWIWPARHVLGELRDQRRIGIDFLNRDFDQPPQAGINCLMITRCHRRDYVRPPGEIDKRAGDRGGGPDQTTADLRQKAALVFGCVAWSGQPSQKQPSTKTARR